MTLINETKWRFYQIFALFSQSYFTHLGLYCTDFSTHRQMINADPYLTPAMNLFIVWQEKSYVQYILRLVQYTISLSSLCKFVWRHWTYKMPVKYILSSVWVRLSIFSPLSIIQYVGLYVFSLPISVVMIEIIYIYFVLSSSIRKYELWPITHCLGLGHESMVSAVCLSIFLRLVLFISSFMNARRCKAVSVPFHGIWTNDDVMRLAFHLR